MELHSDRQRVAAIDKDIDNVFEEVIRVQKRKGDHGTITHETKELDRLQKSLERLEESRKDYVSCIEQAIRNQRPWASRKYIQEVSGVDAKYREWTSYVIDESIQPGPEFRTAFENVDKAFYELNEDDCRNILNLFLNDIILRPEFDEMLRIFPGLELTVEKRVGTKRCKLGGIMDYLVGCSKGSDMRKIKIPADIHLVAVVVESSVSDEDVMKCVAQATTLFKTHVDAGKVNKSVWGIVTNATTWQFIFIDEDGLLWQSRVIMMNCRRYEEEQGLTIYRMIYYMVKCCYEACTPSPSPVETPPSITDGTSI